MGMVVFTYVYMFTTLTTQIQVNRPYIDCVGEGNHVFFVFYLFFRELYLKWKYPSWSFQKFVKTTSNFKKLKECFIYTFYKCIETKLTSFTQISFPNQIKPSIDFFMISVGAATSHHPSCWWGSPIPNCWHPIRLVMKDGWWPLRLFWEFVQIIHGPFAWAPKGPKGFVWMTILGNMWHEQLYQKFKPKAFLCDLYRRLVQFDFSHPTKKQTEM